MIIQQCRKVWNQRPTIFEKSYSIRKRFLLFLLFVSLFSSVWANDSIQSKRPKFISAQFSGGFIIPNSKIANEKLMTPLYGALTLKYGIGARGDNWKDQFYKMPYRGIGAYIPRFNKSGYLGKPFSLFLFQGGELKRFRPDLSLHYEINLGVSFNWKHYHPVDNLHFRALGSSTNVHLAGSWYFKWRLSQYLDLHTGLSFTHFSNGAQRTPNNGLNALSTFVELAYYLNREKKQPRPTGQTYTPPPFERNTAHDFMVLFTTRSIKIDTTGNGMNTKFPRKKFKVAGVSYSYLFHNSRRFLFGPSLELVYDESANVDIQRRKDHATGEEKEYYRLGKVSDRFSAGLSLKGELLMPGYSIFANMGLDILHPNQRDKRFYSIYGIKVYLTEQLFGTFGVRSTNFTQSQYLYFNIGYTIRRYKK